MNRSGGERKSDGVREAPNAVLLKGGSSVRKWSRRRLTGVLGCGLVLCFLLLACGRAEEVAAPAPSGTGASPSVQQPKQPAPPPEPTFTPMLALDTVVALVNSQAITLDDLQHQSSALLEYSQRRGRPEEWPRIREAILKAQLEVLIDKTLILMEAKQLGARVDDWRVREAIMSLRELKSAFEGDLAKYLVARGMTYRQLYDEIADQLLYSGMVQAKMLPKVRVSPTEIEQYYQKNIEKFTEQAAIHCFAITFMKRDNPESAAAVLTKARQALQKIAAGGYFPDVAKEYSEDPAHAEKGGDWGWITPQTLEKKASDAAFALKEGEFSGVVEGDAAYWILWVKEKRDMSVIPLSAAWREIELDIKTQKLDAEIRRWGQALRRKAAITYPVPISEILGK